MLQSKARRWLGGVLIALGLQACAHGPAPAPRIDVRPLVVGSDLRAGVDYPTQRLYRVRYQGPEGQGSLKLTLRLERPERFQLSAADPLGRALWSLEQRSEAVRFIDHRRRVGCDLPAEIRLPQIVLANLPVRSLPLVLLGHLPSVPATPLEDPGSGRQRLEYTDAAGRRWSAVMVAGEAESWTLWKDDRPLLWWSRQPAGGILSAREGAQFRWRESVSESLSGALMPLEIPVEYEVGECDAEGLS